MTFMHHGLENGLAMSPKYSIIGDMNISKTEAIPGRILTRVHSYGKGAAFTPKDFCDLANSDAIKQALGRLANSGRIRRVMRGVYDCPKHSAILNAPSYPEPDNVAKAIARANGWTITPSGETALNLLGLSTQVQSTWTYFSDGPSRNYNLNGSSIVFKRRANKEISALSPRTALLIQALKSLGEDGVNGNVMKKLRKSFQQRELAKALREARYARSWAYEIIKRLNEPEGNRHEGNS